MEPRATIAQRRLSKLPRHDVRPGEPDIRGWLALGAHGHRIGRIRDIVVCLESWRPRHVELALDRGLAYDSGTECVVVPVGGVELDPRRRVVHLRCVTREEVGHAPRFGAGPIGDEEERMLLRYFRCGLAADELTRFWGIRRRGREAEPYVAALEQDATVR